MEERASLDTATYRYLGVDMSAMEMMRIWTDPVRVHTSLHPPRVAFAPAARRDKIAPLRLGSCAPWAIHAVITLIAWSGAERCGTGSPHIKTHEKR
eukprot:IDg5131t1